MMVLSVIMDFVVLMMMIVVDFNEFVECVWELWNNLRLFEWWWGLLMYFVMMMFFDFVFGGKVLYFMLGFVGEVEFGWW